MIRRNLFLDYVDRFSQARILVIGPAVVEADICCHVDRLAPDRAMPVYRVASRSTHPGGAALTAATIRNLGAEVSLLAPVGAGAPGQSLRHVLDSLNIHLIEGGNGSTRTPELFRYLSASGGGGQQLLQLRRGWKPGQFSQLQEQLESALIDPLTKQEHLDAVCVVDALPASLTADDLKMIAEFCTAHDLPFIFDAAGGSALPFVATLNSEAGVSHLIVNETESLQPLADPPSDPLIRLHSLCAEVAPNVLLTRGRHGAEVGCRSVDSADQETATTSISTPVHALSDRRGVGFVTSGVFALSVSRAVNANPDEAAFLACRAASAAAALPGPKAVTIDDVLLLAYHEIAVQVADGVEVFERIAREQLPVIDRAARILLECYTNDKQVLVFGNGGSAAEANHLVTELTGQFCRKRAALPAISLSSNDALATCIANDYGFEDLFSRQVEAFCREGDVVIAMSTSGKSPNVIKGLEEARKRGAHTIGFTGERPGHLDDLCDVLLAVPSTATPRIQEAHLFVIHVMCEMLDQRVDHEGKLHPSASRI